MFIDRINKNHDNLTTTDFTIIQYILSNKDSISLMSIQELSDKIYISPASIVRLAKKLQYSGFSEMKYELKNNLEINGESSEDSIISLEKDIKETLNFISAQNLDPIAKKIDEAKRIFSFGTDWGERLTAQHLSRNFLACNIFIHQIPSNTEFLWLENQFNENDVCIIISFSGENEYIKSFIPQLKAQGVTIISITPLSRNFLSSISDFNLYYHTTMINIDSDSRSDYNFYSSLFVLTDYLFRFYYDNYYID